MIETKMKEILKKRNISQKDAAVLLGITPGELSHWFVGRAKIKADDIKRFCEAFNTTPNYLMGFEDEISESDRIILDAIKTAKEREEKENSENKNHYYQKRKKGEALIICSLYVLIRFGLRTNLLCHNRYGSK